MPLVIGFLNGEDKKKKSEIRARVEELTADLSFKGKITLILVDAEISGNKEETQIIIANMRDDWAIQLMEAFGPLEYCVCAVDMMLYKRSNETTYAKRQFK